jgi:hypothetical protein
MKYGTVYPKKRRSNPVVERIKKLKVFPVKRNNVRLYRSQTVTP